MQTGEQGMTFYETTEQAFAALMQQQAVVDRKRAAYERMRAANDAEGVKPAHRPLEFDLWFAYEQAEQEYVVMRAQYERMLRAEEAERDCGY